MLLYFQGSARPSGRNRLLSSASEFPDSVHPLQTICTVLSRKHPVHAPSLLNLLQSAKVRSFSSSHDQAVPFCLPLPEQVPGTDASDPGSDTLDEVLFLPRILSPRTDTEVLTVLSDSYRDKISEYIISLLVREKDSFSSPETVFCLARKADLLPLHFLEEAYHLLRQKIMRGYF